MESLKDQSAVVTGASSGIGKAMALSLAGQGAEVRLVARRCELLEDVAKQIHALGSRGHACPGDLTKHEDIRGLGERFQKEFGHVNILVLCGGAIFHGPLEKASLADFDLMYRSNVRGHYLMIQTLLPLLRKSAGQIVFINSSAGLRSPPPLGSFPPCSMPFDQSQIACAMK
jgi:NAD(P)-dependent dehydrogenase (short-subunit alcohol dehydrogenase family)